MRYQTMRSHQAAQSVRLADTSMISWQSHSYLLATLKRPIPKSLITAHVRLGSKIFLRQAEPSDALQTVETSRGT